MTNRKSLALVIPMLLAVGNGANALEIFNKNGSKLEFYGKINPNHELSHGFLSTKISSHNDNTNAILGLSGEINITDELLSYAAIEYQTDFFAPEELINAQQANTVRLGYAGFKYGNWGSIDYGRNYGVLHDAQSLINHDPYITKKSIFTENDNYMIGRNSSFLTYRNDNIFGLVDGMSFTVQHQDDITSKADKKRNNSGWGASLKYESDIGLTAIGSCFSYNKTELEENKSIPSVNAYGLGFKYDDNDIYIAAFYGAASNLTTSSNNDVSMKKYLNSEGYINKIENIEAIAEYNFHSGFYPSLSYLDSTAQNINVEKNSNQSDIELEKQINISTRYEFNKNISTYMNYKINLLKKNDLVTKNKVATDNIIGAGIVYQF